MEREVSVKAGDALKLYLVGFMGAGKTTVGKLLADRLEIPFFDLDDLVETAESMTIREIFATHGEPYFRSRERDLLETTGLATSGVIATGGGTFTFRENIDLVREFGRSIYLAPSYSILRNRIDGTSAERPMFHDEMALHRLFNNRTRFYEEADIIVEISESETEADVVERICRALAQG